MGLAGALLLTGALASAQAPDSLPSATEPQGPPVQLFAQVGPALLTADTQRGGIGKRSTDMSPVGHEPNDAPVVSMAPHSEDSLWWLSGQANIIIQGDLPFHSPLPGDRTASLAGLSTRPRWWARSTPRCAPNHSIRYNTDFIFDLEAAEGRGLSEALGLAGFTNLDVVRNPNLGTAALPRPLPDSPGHRLHQQDHRPGAGPLCAGAQRAAAARRVPRRQDDAAGLLRHQRSSAPTATCSS